MTEFFEGLAFLGRSDLSGYPQPEWYRWLTVQSAHILLGIMLAFMWRWFAALFVMAWVAKELASDLPYSGWGVLVVLDSISDVVAGWLGYTFSCAKLMALDSDSKQGKS
ncbi:MAG: hypothetical protein V4712_12450 [Pseudomonadota bacterium]